MQDRTAEEVIDELVGHGTTPKKRVSVSEIIAEGKMSQRERLEIAYQNLKVVGRVILMNEITKSEYAYEPEPAKDLTRGLIEIAYLIDSEAAHAHVLEFEKEVAAQIGG